MEIHITIIYLLAMMRFSAAEKLKRNLSGVVEGNVTFPNPVLEFGFILEGMNNIAMVNDRKLQFVEEKYKNKLHWNRNSGLFTITDLQKNDSGVYKIDSKRGRVIAVSYFLTVYDGAPTPAVETLTVSSDSCWLLCSVDKATSLLWYKDQEVQNQNSSASSLPITVHKEDRDSSYRCVAANPAENKTLHVNVRTACGFNETESGDNPKQRAYLIGVGVSVLLVVFVVGAFWMIKQRYLGKKQPVRQDTIKEDEVQYTPILFKDNRHSQGENIPESSGTSDHADLTTVYAKLEHPNPNIPSLG